MRKKKGTPPSLSLSLSFSQPFLPSFLTRQKLGLTRETSKTQVFASSLDFLGLFSLT